MRSHLYQFLIGLGLGVAGQFIDKAWPSAPRELYWAIVGAALVVVIYALLGVARDWLWPTNVLSDSHESDGAEAFVYLRNHSKWAECEVRRLNFRELIDCRQEFRRAARDDGLRTSGTVRYRGAPFEIDARYWIGARVVEGSEVIPFGLSSKTEASSPSGTRQYNNIKVNTNDMKRIWPQASWVDLLMTKIVVGTKRAYYLVTPDAWAYRWRRWTS